LSIPAAWIVPEWPAPANVRALITTRAGGASSGAYASLNLGGHVGDDARAVAANRDALRRLLPAEPVWLRQVHGARVVEAVPGSAGEEADAAVAREPGRVCAVLTADCLPVLLADEAGTVVAIAHAGWRGLAAGVIENVVYALESGGVAPGSLIAYLGPAIGGGAYEVGSDVFETFVRGDAGAATAFAPQDGGKFLADLNVLARQRLSRLGVRRVHGGSLCTYSDAARFYSYRRDRTTGRMASLVWLERM
jgi:YfiH family protein